MAGAAVNVLDYVNYNLTANLEGYSALQDVQVLRAALKEIDWGWKGSNRHNVKYKASPIAWVLAAFDLDTGAQKRTYAEAAQVFGCHPSTYRARLRRALKLARRHLIASGQLVIVHQKIVAGKDRKVRRPLTQGKLAP